MVDSTHIEWQYHSKDRSTPFSWRLAITCALIMVAGIITVAWLAAYIGTPVPWPAWVLLPLLPIGMLLTPVIMPRIEANVRVMLDDRRCLIQTTTQTSSPLRPRVLRTEQRTAETPWERLRRWQYIRTTVEGEDSPRYRVWLLLRRPIESMVLALPDEASAQAVVAFLRSRMPAIPSEEVAVVLPGKAACRAILMVTLAWVCVVAVAACPAVHLVHPNPNDWVWLPILTLVGPGLPYSLTVGVRKGYVTRARAFAMAVGWNLPANMVGLFLSQLPTLILYLLKYRPGTH